MASASPPPLIASASGLLALLARKGAWGETCRDGDVSAVLSIFAPRNATFVCLGQAPEEIQGAAASSGWITQDAGQKWRLTRAGRVYLQRGLNSRAERASEHTRGEACHGGRPDFNPAESPIHWLSRRKDKDGKPMLTQVELDAGERLRTDFSLGHMTPRVTTSWSEPLGERSGRRAASRGLEPSERAAAAQERVRRALAAVGPELSGILIDVCCHLTKLEDAERACQWPQRSAKLVLRLALSSLARHYGLHPGGDAPSERRIVRHWGVAGYRPAVDEAPS